MITNDTCVVIGTGPSLTQEQLDWIWHTDVITFDVNNVYQIYPDLDVLMSCNIEWWDYYMNTDPKLEEHPCDKWTWDKKTAEKYNLNYIEGRWGDGLSKDRRYIHYGHSSGFQVINLAYLFGFKTIILVGYDMKYQPGYDKKTRNPGEKRHYFGEYPKDLQHFPSVGPNGEFTGLLAEYAKIPVINTDLNIINCTPDSALTCFEMRPLEEVL